MSLRSAGPVGRCLPTACIHLSRPAPCSADVEVGWLVDGWQTRLTYLNCTPPSQKASGCEEGAPTFPPLGLALEDVVQGTLCLAQVQFKDLI